MSDDDLTATRRAKLQELRAAGGAYPNDFRPEHRASRLHAAFATVDAAALEGARPPARIAGRIVGKRSFGQAMFVVVDDGEGRIQAYLRRDQLEADAWAIARSLDLGDQVGCAGVSSARRPTNSRSPPRRSGCSRSACTLRRRSGMVSPTSRCATASATST